MGKGQEGFPSAELGVPAALAPLPLALGNRSVVVGHSRPTQFPLVPCQSHGAAAGGKKEKKRRVTGVCKCPKHRTH